MAESCEEYSDGCSVDSYEDFESPSPSCSSEEARMKNVADLKLAVTSELKCGQNWANDNWV